MTTADLAGPVEGIGKLFMFLGYLMIPLSVLGIWKLLDILLWFFHHLHWS